MTEDGRRPPAAPSREEIDLLRVALDHSRAWWTQHADQRLRALNFWVVAMAFLTTAYVGTVASDPALATAIAVLGALVSIAFQRLERRTRELVKRAEEALSPAETRLALLTGIEELLLVKRSDKKAEPLTSYGTVIATLQLMAILGFTVAAWVASQRIR